MNIYMDNVNFESQSGPNHFGTKLKKYLEKLNVKVNKSSPDLQLSFIESMRRYPRIPLVQRLDGIYFNKAFDYNLQNKNILDTYRTANGVIFQSEFNRRLTFQYFGVHPNSTVIRNGADVELISSIPAMSSEILKKHDKVWCCASSWRPHKRLQDNINYFLDKSSENDCLFIAGETAEIIKHDRIFYMGTLPLRELISLYKASDYFIHLAWLDHCPNVVVDARASGCRVICSSTGGTSEVAGADAIIIQEPGWDLSPVDLYKPPAMNYSMKNLKNIDSKYDMRFVAKQYKQFLKKLITE